MRLAQVTASQCPIPNISSVRHLNISANILPWRKTLTNLLAELTNVKKLRVRDDIFTESSVLPAGPLPLLAPTLVGELPEPVPALGHLFPLCKDVRVSRVDFDKVLYSGNTHQYSGK
ncbi:hypothetical protein OF83DRAFT_1176120 [Amylostereum chailletii]|nr:hypothetical protein OF83DRAFT_1176120 [Amylostereum chailletii]